MQPPVSYTPLEQDNLRSLGTQIPSFNGGGAASLFATTSFLWSLFFVLIVMAAFSRYVVAGGLRMQASESSIRQSNEIIKKVTFGLVGVFSLFILLFTVNKGLVTGDVGLEELRVKGSGSQAIPISVPSGPPAVVTGVSRAAPTNASMQAAIDADPSVRKDLALYKIGVNKAACKTPSEASCTTVGGLPDATIAMLKSVRSVCNSGNLIISGGTEAGHSSHGPGKYPVDISIVQSSAQVNSCIRSFTPSKRVPKRSASVNLCYPGEVYENFGFVFCDEAEADRHWHVYKP